ncbi:MAG: NADH-quinone oxidoreductase subunit M [Candidatus Accumulibacter phosphatis]|uniref:NADH-quinone oxidoreductase subunit M n=1 Tax=Candidatus Accumulibacter cognatus TaxID=2954383 RepID=A0A080M9W7_9PROT|nr:MULTISPECIES: NADH-quinone oxidoreductase subunit M [Candidatus Accumulibacter]MCC2867068.1 NADH-quinone oxidoreductase subunit M [Candidatus Accumulibacter phosphatis]KFB77250.1 MAG: NADH-quinone oxidoreductase subunit M [Candidatus Accumulibacter cognatus]MBN8518032.1 NADH-quinone oxidoreductase subunit M [Accumulibacter sp.]MBO3710451.1 NADH-quinone oxidoreductase subunit M [Accumulibacter sp.]MCM8580914.1 NADH-quinone oxidoreductase subunit M [Accumulibacter sp.]
MIELASWPLLSTLLSMPLLGALLASLWPRKVGAQWIALGSAVLTLLCSLLIVAAFDTQDSDFQLLDSVSWIPGVNIHYLVGVDGLSLLFLPATALLFCGAVVAGWRRHAPAADAAPPGVYFALLLLLEAATLGVFCALDSILFFCFWEFTLLPLYFLVSLWGLGAGRQAAAVRYFLVMLAGGVPLLFGILVLAFGHAELSGVLHFDLPTLLGTALPERTQYLVFLLLLAGFGVKVPLLPLHTWLPALAMGAPAAVTAVLVGLKLGAYGLIRFAIPLAPLAARELHWLLAGCGTVAILYGSVAALAQSNLRAVLAYASLSHVGLVVLGLASFSVSALQGALLQLLNFSVAAGGGFLVLAFLQRRSDSTDISQLGGVIHRMPLLSGFFLLFGLAGIGLPGTSGFPGELLIIVETLHSHTGAGLAALFAMVLAAAAFLSPFRQAFLGPLRNPDLATADDLLPRELVLLLLPTLLILAVGFYPLPILELLRPSAEAWVAALAGL